MSETKCCWNCIYDDLKQAHEEPCVSCRNHSNFKEYKPTNYDRIRNMSVDELVEFMNKCGWDFPPYCDYMKATRGICDNNCLQCAKVYLESEVDTE